MRSKLLGLVLGCGLVAVTVVPALACAFHTSSNDQSQQTAQAQSSPDVKTQ